MTKSSSRYSTSECGASGHNRCGIIVILFGSLEFDGRVQRVVEILSEIGDVTLFDLKPPGCVADASADKIERKSLVPWKSHWRRLSHMRLAWHAILHAWRSTPDIVVAEDYFTTLSGWLAAKISRAKLIYDAHELIIPDSDRFMRIRDRIWYWCERWVATRASLVIAANPERAELMRGHYRLARPPIYMRNIPARQTGSPSMAAISAAGEYVKRMRVTPGDKVVLYQGVIVLKRGLGRFIEALRHCPANYRFVVVGDGPDVDALQELADRNGVADRVVLLGRVPNKILGLVTVAADVGVVTYPYRGLNNLYCAPNKIFEYIQAGVPVIATDQEPLRTLVNEYRIGELIDKDSSASDISAAILCVVSHKDVYVKEAVGFLNDNNWDEEASRVRRAIHEVITT